MIGVEKSTLPALLQAQLAARTERLFKSNEISGRYGLALSEPEIRSLISAEGETLRACGRLEFGEGILPRLIYTFCDSPFIVRGEYYDTLEALQDLFYAFKNDLYDALSDDELLEAMHRIFHGKAQGSLDYLENIAAEDLIRALRGGTDGDEDDD
jgi:hypothetical protein